MNEAGVEGVTSADIVHKRDRGGRQAPLLFAGSANRRTGAALYHYDLGQAGEQIQSLRKILRAGDLFCLAIIGQENVNVLQYFEEVLLPAVFGIIIGVEGSGEASVLGLSKQGQNARPQSPVQ